MILAVRLTPMLLLVVEIGCQTTSPLRARQQPESYVLQGIVRDSSNGDPVAGARIWPYLKRWGVVSDDEGRYKLHWTEYGTSTFLVRLCEDRNLLSFPVAFSQDSVLTRDIRIAALGKATCTSGDRVPWAVDSSDTTRFTGHYTYSWEGGGRLTGCDGASFAPDWDSALGRRLRKRQHHEGQVSFVQFLGRVAQDHLVDELAPGYFVNYHGPLFLVNRVEEVRDPRPGDCR